jgi:NitT/TauT family transport system permease protein
MATEGLARPVAAPRLRLGPPARRWAFNLLYLAIFIGAWELVVELMRINSLLLPAPSAILAEAIDAGSVIVRASALTLWESVLGFLLAAVVGIFLAIVIVYSPLLRSVVLSTIVGINATPKIAVAPILVIWLGLGIESKIAMAFLLSFFPIVINSARGLADVPHELLDLYRLMHASRWQVFRKVRLPNALPAMFDGFKIALPISMIGAVAGEFIVGQGIGYQIKLASANFNTEFMFAGVITVAIMGVLLFQVLVLVEDRLIFWRPSKQRS